MSTHISDQFSKLPITITDHQMEQIEELVIIFETRQSAPLALNSPLLGVYKIFFTDSDRASLFSVFGTDEKIVSSVIKKISSIDKNRKVSSDPFNVFSVWIMHLAYNLVDDKNKRDAFLFNMAKLLHYKMFTSVVNHAFPYGATEKIMVATINSLTKKYDIIVYGTWKKTLEARCRDLINEEDGIHREHLQHAGDDEKFLYIISDTQTRIRDKVGNIVTEYYKTRERGDTISGRSSTMEIEGEKILVQTTSTFDTAISSICAEVMSVNLFIDRTTVAAIARQYPNISYDMLRSSLVNMSELAVQQQASGKLDFSSRVNGAEIFIGVRALITAIIQKSFRYCIKQHVDLSNKAIVYARIKNVYSSSRISDPDITSVKASVAIFTDSIGKTKRETTKSSLRLAILLYIIVKAFQSL